MAGSKIYNMSKKNKANQQSKNKETAVELANLSVADVVGVKLPTSLSKGKVNSTLMESYLHTKLLNKKLVSGQSFVCAYLGKEHTFAIQSINHSVATEEVKK